MAVSEEAEQICKKMVLQYPQELVQEEVLK